jgi:hypothetical protein
MPAEVATMSTVAAEPSTARHWPGVESAKRVLYQTAHSVTADLHRAPRYFARYGVAVLALFGAISLWGAAGDGPLPAFTDLLAPCGINPTRVSSSHCFRLGTSAEARWAGLAPALAILDRVNPDVAAWVRDEKQGDNLVFTDSYQCENDQFPPLAKYDHFRGTLTVNRGIFAENDGTAASLLCHEYRHSRQSLPKVVLHALSFLIRPGGDSSIVENDAMLYERDACVAIFGAYRRG